MRLYFAVASIRTDFENGVGRNHLFKPCLQMTETCLAMVIECHTQYFEY